MKKRLLSFFLAVLMVAALLPTAIIASAEEPAADLSWQYCETIEYLDGTDGFNLGEFTAQDRGRIEVDFAWDLFKVKSSDYLFGCYPYCSMYWYKSASEYQIFPGYGEDKFVVTFKKDNLDRFTYVLDITNKTYQLYGMAEEASFAEQISHSLNSHVGDFGLLGNYSGGTVSGFPTGKFYGAKIYNTSGVLIHDYVPAKNINGAYGIYDNITEKFISSVNGSFTGGGEAADFSVNAAYLNHYYPAENYITNSAAFRTAFQNLLNSTSASQYSELKAILDAITPDTPTDATLNTKLSGSNVKKSLSLLDNVNINIKVINDASNDVSAYTDWKLIVKNSDGMYIDTIADWHVGSNGTRIWTSFKVVGKDIGTTYKFQIFANDGDGKIIYGDVFEYSVNTYCDAIKAGSFSTEMKTLADSVKAYGAAAKAADGVDSGITAGAYQAYNAAAGFDSKISGTNIKKSLSLMESINLNIKVINDTNNNVSAYTDWQLVVKNSDGTNDVATISEWNDSADNRKWCTFDLTALDINTVYTFRISAKNGGNDVTGESFTYSIAQYCDDLKAATEVAVWDSFADSVKAYGTAAKAYFDSLSK